MIGDEKEEPKSRNSKALLLLTICGLISLFELRCQTAALRPAINLADSTYDGWGFSISIPSTCEVTISKAVDFDVYSIRDKNTDKPLLAMFATFQPSFPEGIPSSAKRTSRKVNGKKAQYAHWKESGLACAEALIKLREKKEIDWRDPKPMFLHSVYGSLSTDNAALAESIIDSVRPK